MAEVQKLRVPDAPGGKRFCTACDSWLSVGEFPLGPRRYTCKKHMWANAGRKAKAKRMADINKRILFRLWGKAYDDSKRFSCAWRPVQDGEAQSNNLADISITQREIEQFLIAATNYSSKDVYANPMAFARRIAVVPINPTKVLSLSNAALVTNVFKRQLFQVWKLNGLHGYTSVFSKAEGSNKEVFVPSRKQLKTMQSAMNPLLKSGFVSDHSSSEEGEVTDDETDCTLQLSRINE